MFVSSMVMVSAASEGTFEIEDSVKGMDIDLTVDYDDTTVRVGGAGNTNYKHGNFDMEGTIGISDKTYNVDMTADGRIRMKGDEECSTLTSDLLLARLSNVEGKAYQNGETQYLYKDGDNKYYGYIESGYNIEDGYIKYREYKNGHERLEYGLNLNVESWYSEYVITKSKPIGEFTLSSPPLGLGYKGSVAGDSIPPLYTYRDQNTWERVVSETYPENHDGAVICTPARIAGEPLVPTGYWETAKGQRTSEWKANNN